ncbi:MAG: response regulator, partial [Candidatus Eisenbacteria bacterium]
MVGHPIRVLHVEDSPGDARLLREALKGGRLAFEIECADTMVGGLERLAAGGWDVVLLDLALPDSSGLESVSRVRAARPDVPIATPSTVAMRSLLAPDRIAARATSKAAPASSRHPAMMKMRPF